MFEILKWFFSIVVGLILIYVIVIIFQAVFSSFVNTAGTAAQNTATTTNVIASTTGKVLASAKRFTWQDFVNYFKFPAPPISVVPNITSSMYANVREDQQFRYQNINDSDAPDNHPTDWAPVDQRPFDEKWGIHYNNQDNYQYRDIPVRNYYNHNFPQLKMLFPSRVLMREGY